MIVLRARADQVKKINIALEMRGKSLICRKKCDLQCLNEDVIDI